MGEVAVKEREKIHWRVVQYGWTYMGGIRELWLLVAFWRFFCDATCRYLLGDECGADFDALSCPF